jgi:hypothetical protein
MGRRIPALFVVAGLGLAIGMATPSRAHAQAKENSIAIVGGIYTYNEFQGDTDPLIGARWTSFITPSVGAGASFDWIPAGNGLTVLGYDVDISFRVPTRSTTEPFFTLGAGGISFTGGGSTHTYFAGILGAGVRTSVAKNVGLVFEARDRIYHATGDLINDFHFTGGVEFPF